ncbi:lipoprotein [Pseudomonas sp. Os17]|nr:lipoprotein [Pseudomonas sp. Os17]
MALHRRQPQGGRRAPGGDDQVRRLKLEPSGSGSLYSDDMLAFHVKGEEGLVYWVATNDLIGRGCKAM